MGFYFSAIQSCFNFFLYMYTACSEAYSMSSYPFMNNMNSQLAEQLNNSLRKLSTVAAYSKVDTYIKILEVFITVRNLSVKKII